MKRICFQLCALLCLLSIGCVSPTAVAPMSSTETNASSSVGLYRLRALDPLRIELLGIPMEKMLETNVDENGEITLPYLEESIQVVGMTTSELEQRIERLYTENLIYKQITINILTSAKIYYLEGYVKRPQEYPLTHRITLLQAIASASGFTEYANQKNVTITRGGKVYQYNAKDLEKNPELDPTIEAGDRIKVHRSRF